MKGEDHGMKRPAFQFYPGDWLRDSALQSCSMGARGLWIQMLCIMHDGSPYGHLKVGGKVIHKDNLARMTGITSDEAEGWLRELEEAGVFSRDAEGAIFSRRMVRDEGVRKKRSEGGSKGGNPALLSGAAGRKVNPKVNPKVAQISDSEITPASASASASALLLLPGSDEQGGKGAGDSKLKHERKEAARRILLHLNAETGRNFRETDVNLKLITARLDEPDVTEAGVRQMVTRMTSQWKGDPRMEEFLRPATLFGKEKFGGYYDLREVPATNGRSAGTNGKEAAPWALG